MRVGVWRNPWAVRVAAVAAVLATVLAGLGPGPASADFEDGGEGVHAPAIGALAELGVFEGTECGDGLFCPDEPLLRRDMAVWLVRVLAQRDPLPEGWASWEPPTESRFGDVADDAWWMASVERLADLGVTLGCSAEPAMYCPDRPVTRAQMASFLGRAFALQPPEAPAGFADIVGSVHAADIEALAAAGITVGCAAEPLRFCPQDPTTRAEMATFLKRAYTAYVGPCPTETEEPEEPEATGGGGGGGGGGGFVGPPPPPPPSTSLPGSSHAPRSVAVEAGDESLSVSWSPPGAEGSEIVGYRVQWKGPGEDYSDDERWEATAELSYEIAGLDNGVEYSVRVSAGFRNIGFGPWASATGVPRTVPGEPRSPAVTAGEGTMTVTWLAPADDGGSPVAGYRVQWSADQSFDASDPVATVAGDVLSREVTNLAAGTQHWARVSARNEVGDGPWSATVSAGAPPGVPRGLGAQPGDGSISLTWQAPEAVGELPVTGYRVRWRSSGETFGPDRQASVTGTAHEITGLTNGVEQTVQVQALNDAGPGPGTQTSATPRTVPNAPANVVVYSNAGTLALSWDPPASDGGSPVTGYRVQWKGPDQQYSDTERTKSVTTPRHQITGLTTGTEYTVRVRAENAGGLGAALESVKVVSVAPSVPRSATVRAFDSSLLVSFVAPENSGTTPITRHLVLWKGSGETYDASRCSFRRVVVDAGGDLQAVLGPLVNGASYDLRVVSYNDGGPGTPLDLTGTPASKPGQPEALGAFPFDGGLLIDWDEPWDGGSPITGYRVQWKGPGEEYSDTERRASVGSSTLSHKVSGLTNGTEYTVRAVTSNANGDSLSAEAKGTPGDAPGAPASLTLTTLGNIWFTYTVRLSWTPPTDTGGSPITGYRVDRRTDDRVEYTDGITVSASTRSHDFVLRCVSPVYPPPEYMTAICQKLRYAFRVSAVNSAGAGAPAETTFERPQ